MERADRIRGVLLDVDGVLTDGRLVFDADGERLKSFHARDGHRIRRALETGLAVGLCSGRDSPALRRRAGDLGLDPLLLGLPHKPPAVEAWLDERGWGWDEIAVVGDDLPDLILMRRAGLAIAPADADASVRRIADVVCRAPGGHGAVAEALEELLRRQGRWNLAHAAGEEDAGS